MEKKKNLSSILAVLAFSLVAKMASSVNSLITVISESYPDVPSTTIRLISTLTPLASTISALIVGVMIGRKLTYRAAGIIGSAIGLIFGLIPIFADSMGMILFSRVMVGVGIGMFGMRNAYIIQAFEGKQRDSVLGIEVTVSNAAPVLISLVVGFLGEISWRAGFSVYALLLIPLLTSIFLLKEPEYTQTTIEKKDKSKKNPIHITAPVWFFFVFLFFATMTIYPVVLGMSTVLAERNLGGPAATSLVTSSFVIGGIIAGLLFEPVSTKIGSRWMLLYSCILVIVGQTVLIFSQSVVIMAIFTCIAGWGWCTLVPAIMTKVPEVADPNSIPISATLISAVAVQGGMFLSGYWIEICSIFPLGTYSVEKAWWVGLVSYILLALICILWNPNKGREELSK